MHAFLHIKRQSRNVICCCISESLMKFSQRCEPKKLAFCLAYLQDKQEQEAHSGLQKPRCTCHDIVLQRQQKQETEADLFASLWEKLWRRSISNWKYCIQTHKHTRVWQCDTVCVCVCVCVFACWRVSVQIAWISWQAVWSGIMCMLFLFAWKGCID